MSALVWEIIINLVAVLLAALAGRKLARPR